MDYTKLSDEALLVRIARSEEEALSVFYDRFSRLVYSIAYNIVNHQATAEEITLDIFGRVWDKADVYDSSRAKVSTWLTSMTRNRAIDTLRREAVRPEKYSVGWAEPGVTPNTVSRTAEVAVDLALRQQRIRAAVARLPAEQQEVLALAYFRGYTQREIAQMCDLPLGTVKTRTRLAMERLRLILTDGD